MKNIFDERFIQDHAIKPIEEINEICNEHKSVQHEEKAK
jgi:hypothetical protein